MKLADPMAGLRFTQRARHFAARGLFEQLWFVPAWIGLGLASLVIRFVAFRRIASVLGHHYGTVRPQISPSADQQARAVQIRRTLQLAEHYAPWRADCYPQAIVARVLLGLYRLPFVLTMGLKRDSVSGEVQAHAWVQCGTTPVTGGEGDGEYSAVAVFAKGVVSGSENGFPSVR